MSFHVVFFFKNWCLFVVTVGWTEHEIIKKHTDHWVCKVVGHPNLMSLVKWQHFWNKVVYLEHLYEE